MIYVRGALVRRKTVFTNIPRFGLDELVAALSSIDPASLRSFKICLNGTDDYLQAAQIALEKATGDPVIASALVDDELEKLAISFADIVMQTPQQMIASLEMIGTNSIWYFHNILKILNSFIFTKEMTS